MSDGAHADNSFASSWGAHWRNAGAQQAAGAVTGFEQSERLKQTWTDFFSREAAARDRANMIDLGCGAGAVINYALALLPIIGHWSVFGVDYAPDAVRRVSRLGAPGGNVAGIAADLDALPFASNAADVIVSQFGLEYAAPDAFAGAARLLAPGGVLHAIAHIKGGAIDMECRANLGVISKIEQSGVVEAAQNFFAPGSRYELGARNEIASKLRDISTGVDRSIPAWQVANYFAEAMLRFISRPQAFSHVEIRAWLDGVVREMQMYAARMQAMTEAALDETQLDAITRQLEDAGVVTELSEKMTFGAPPRPAAWRLEARRP